MFDPRFYVGYRPDVHEASLIVIDEVSMIDERMQSAHTQKWPHMIDLTKLKPKKVSYFWEPYLANKSCLLDGRADSGMP